MSPQSEVGLSLSGLTKYYGKDVGIEDLTFDVHKGEVVGFLGPNGAGKSTAMRCLVGLLNISSGSATILNQNVASAGPNLRANVGYLPGSPAFYGNLTAQQFLQFLARMRNLNCDAKIAALASRFQLNLDRRIKSQSKGNRQKIGLIQALMHSPQVLILDEPTSALDPLVQHEFAEIMSEETSRGVAVLLSSHVLSEVENLADRVVILNEGHLVLVSEMHELQQRTVQDMELIFAQPVSADVFLTLPSVRNAQTHGSTVALSLQGPVTDVLRIAVEHRVVRVQTSEPSLDEIFYSLVSRDVQ